jgi:hypothetical protein
MAARKTKTKVKVKIKTGKIQPALTITQRNLFLR